MEAASRLHFGALLRKFRLDAGITQQELAERAKLSVEAISTLERGARTRPHRETVVLLGHALGLSPEREALLESAGGVAHPPRRREHSEFPIASLLTVVRGDAQATSKHNLPRQLTSFVGRQREIDEITALLREHPLVTIVGTGGVGKTRVAVKLAGDMLDDYPDGVWLVDLAPIADQALVATAVLIALRLPSATGSASDALVAHLKARRLLLILDNCEHVISSVCEVAGIILNSCPFVRVLSTSREPSKVPGERIYPLPSLTVPPDSSRSGRDVAAYGAVALFVDRALAADASFALSDDNSLAIAEICRRLDGIPLAIELAAARVNVLAPRQIVLWLNQQFRLLTGGDRRALPRHQTMRALIDWSYELLTSREQALFESLSVFAGGCKLDEATAVCAVEGEDDIDIIDLLASLVTKSLLVAELAGDEQRYRLLESSRQFVREKVIARGGLEQLARRHALVYLDLAERLERAWYTTPERAWLSQAKAELENWRASLEWALGKRGDVILGQRLAAARKVLWRTFSLVEGRQWVRTALELVDELTPPALEAKLDHAEAEGSTLFGETNVSLAAAQRAMVRYHDLGDTLGTAWAQSSAGGSFVTLGKTAEGEHLLLDALVAARTLGDRRLAANVLHKLGNARSAVGDFAGARAFFSESLGLAKGLGVESYAVSVASSAAKNEYSAGDPESALRLMVEVLANYRTLNSSTATTGIAYTFNLIAESLIALGRYDEARVQANEALELARGLGLVVIVAWALMNLAQVALLRPPVGGPRAFSQYAGAARLIGFAKARISTPGVLTDYGSEYERALAVLRDAIFPDELTRLTAAGAAMTEDEAIAQAHALE